MSRFLIVHHSRDGQAAAISRRIGQAVESAGHRADCLPYGEAVASYLEECDSVIVGAGVRYGRHGRAFERWVREHRAAIESRPNAFFSVSLSAGGPGANAGEVLRHLDAFTERTGWQPNRIATFAGALRYPRYNFFLRFVMRRIAASVGAETDSRREFEYTDWAAVERFARELAPTRKIAIVPRDARQMPAREAA